jgi:glutamate N-acetyltransferase/amino-acid N-acetyltransferase
MPVMPKAQQAALDYAVQCSFNAISINGDMSTNDTFVLFVNGASAGMDVGPGEAREIDNAHDPATFASFQNGVTEFMHELVQLVVHDSKGTTTSPSNIT